mgnify:FL=1
MEADFIRLPYAQQLKYLAYDRLRAAEESVGIPMIE